MARYGHVLVLQEWRGNKKVQGRLILQARHSQRHGEVEGDLGNDCKIYHSHTVKFELIFGSAGGLLLELSASVG